MNRKERTATGDLGRRYEIGQRALVQCDGFSCWAQQNAKHEWIDLHGNKLEVIEVVTMFC